MTGDNQSVTNLIAVGRRPRWLPATEIVSQLLLLGPDQTGLAEELREVLDDTTDDLPW